MFDNMDPAKIAEGVDVLKKEGLRERVILEASGASPWITSRITEEVG